MAASLKTGITSLLRAGWTWSSGSLFSWGIIPASRCVMKASNQGLGLISNIIMRRITCLTSSNSLSHTGFITASKYNSLSLRPTSPLMEQIRTKVRYSLKKGKPKSVKAVTDRFYRLNWGIWIRTRVGRAKRLWKKTSARKYRLRQHVFCNKTQSKLLDKMVTRFWRKPKYWVNDPYEPYHSRSNFDLYFPEKRRFYP